MHHLNNFFFFFPKLLPISGAARTSTLWFGFFTWSCSIRASYPTFFFHGNFPYCSFFHVWYEEKCFRKTFSYSLLFGSAKYLERFFLKLVDIPCTGSITFVFFILWLLFWWNPVFFIKKFLFTLLDHSLKKPKFLLNQIYFVSTMKC